MISRFLAAAALLLATTMHVRAQTAAPVYLGNLVPLTSAPSGTRIPVLVPCTVGATGCPASGLSTQMLAASALQGATGSGGPSYVPTIGSTTQLGVYKVGTGLSVASDGTLNDAVPAYALPPATQTALGGVKIGTGLTVASDGTLSIISGGRSSYTLPAATASVLGGVKAGAGMAVAGDGTLTIAVGQFDSYGAANAVARYLGSWTANTNYLSNDEVSQGGLLYAAIAQFTSGSTFTASNWTATGLQIGTTSGTAADGGALATTNSNVSTNANAISNLASNVSSYYAPLASPALTGSPTAPTQATADNSDKLATTAWTKLQGFLTGANIGTTTGTIGDGGVLANAVNNISNLVQSIANLAPLASPALTGTPTAPTPAAGDNSMRIPTTAWANAAFVPNRYRVSTVANDTLTAADAYGLVASRPAAAQTMTIGSCLADGVSISIQQQSAYTITMAAGTGVTLANDKVNTDTAPYKSARQYALLTVLFQNPGNGASCTAIVAGATQ